MNGIFFSLRINTQHIKQTQGPGDSWREAAERLHPEVQESLRNAPPYYYISREERCVTTLIKAAKETSDNPLRRPGNGSWETD